MIAVVNPYPQAKFVYLMRCRVFAQSIMGSKSIVFADVRRQTSLSFTVSNLKTAVIPWVDRFRGLDG